MCSLALGGCAAGPAATGDQIEEGSTGRRLSSQDALARLRASDVCLLGELHDNPHHHLRRAELLAALGRPSWVVAEHLTRGAMPVLPASPDAAALLRELEAHGFDRQGWQWPLHQPLFAAVAQHHHALVGGNLPRELAREVARSGGAALPRELQAIVDAAPLGAAAQHALETQLVRGHCGHLPAHRLPAMLSAQRGRDAAMCEAVLARVNDRGGLQGPVILLVGNGHVRRDYGVVPMLKARQPPLRCLSIGFAELGREDAPGELQAYDLLWRTSAVARPDPCGALGSMVS